VTKIDFETIGGSKTEPPKVTMVVLEGNAAASYAFGDCS
jgi:hypothetical protein